MSDTDTNHTHELVQDDWMSDSDALIWRIERNPLLRSTSAAVWLLDEVPSRDRMDAAITRAVNRLPRLRQRVLDDPVTTPHWVDDPYFDLDSHYSWVRLPGNKVRRADVLAYTSRLTDRSFDKDRPLWEFVVVDGMTKGRAAIILKAHHAMADGLGMLEMIAHIVDLDGEGSAIGDDDKQVLERARASALRRPPGEAMLHRAAQEASTGRRLGEATLRAAAELAKHPVGSVQQIGKTTGSVARIVKPATTPLSPLMTGRSMASRFDAVRRPFADVRRASKSVDGTVNDAFVSIVLDGLWRYHDAHGAACERLRLHMPISIRSDDEVGDTTNRVVPMRFEIDVGAVEPVERMAAVKKTLRAVRNEPALAYMNDISAGITRLGQSAALSLIGSMMLGCDVTASNLPGPRFPVWMAGSRIDQFYAFGPNVGSAVNVTMFSYDRAVYLAVNSDRAAVPDGDLLIESIEAAADELIAATS